MVEQNPIVVELGRLPERLAAVLANRSEAEITRRPATDEWSAKEIACHLRDGARIYHERLARTIHEERPLLVGYDEAALARDAAYQDADTAGILPELRAWREQTVRLLADLPSAAWQRIAVHEEIGEMNLVQLAAHMIEHEADHLRGLARMLEAEGPGTSRSATRQT